MKPQDTGWERLVLAARGARDDRDTSAPYGFATRVAALAMAQRPPALTAIFERFSWRALGVAGLLALVSFAANFAFFNGSTDEDLMPDDTVVAALWDV